MAIVLDVQDKLGSGAGDDLIDSLSVDMFARAGQLTTPAGRRYLSPLGMGALDIPAVREWIGAQLDGRKTRDVRDFLELLTPGKPGRRSRILPVHLDRLAEERPCLVTVTGCVAIEQHLRIPAPPFRLHQSMRHVMSQLKTGSVMPLGSVPLFATGGGDTSCHLVRGPIRPTRHPTRR